MNGLGALSVARDSGQYTTYAGASRLAAVLAVAAGLALVAAGLAASLSPATRRLGDLALATGVVWFAPFWVGWEGGPPLVRSLGMVAAGFAFPLLVHLVLAFPTGRLASRGAAALVAAAYFEAALSSLLRALFRDPFLDPDSWSNFTDNVFLVHAAPRLVHDVGVADQWFLVAAAAVLATLCARALVTATGPNRATLRPVLVPGILLAGTTIAYAVALERAPLEDPRNTTFRTIFALGCAAVIAISAGLGWTVVKARVQRRAVAGIVADLGEAPPPGSVEAALASALGDPALRIAYWLPASMRYGDALGRALDEPVPSAGRTVTALARDGRRVAVVSHEATGAELERELGAAVRLALENERLQAEVLAQLDDLRASRARIVEARRRRAPPARARPPRRRAAAAARALVRPPARPRGRRARRRRSRRRRCSDGRRRGAGRRSTSCASSRTASTRRCSPRPASRQPLRRSPTPRRLPVELDAAPDARYPAPVEAAAYVVVTEAVDDAAGAARATRPSRAASEDGRLVVQVRRRRRRAQLADGPPRGPRRRARRPGRASSRRRSRAEIPCA